MVKLGPNVRETENKNLIIQEMSCTILLSKTYAILRHFTKNTTIEIGTRGTG